VKLLTPLLRSKGSGFAFYDDFTGADDTALNVHLPTPIDTYNSGWRRWDAGGNVKIVSNAAKNTVLDSYCPTCVDTGLTDCLVSAQFTYKATVGYEVTALITRLVDRDNYWQLYVYSDGGVHVLNLRDYTGGVATVRDSESLTLEDGHTYQLSVETIGTTIIGRCGDVSVSFVSSAHQAGTRQGIGFYAIVSLANVSRLDNFSVKNRTSAALTRRGIFALGDSKTEAALDYYDGHPVPLVGLLEAETGDYWMERPTRYGLAGGTIAELHAWVDGAMFPSFKASPAPEFVLINVGVNDVANAVIEENFIADYNAVITALHAKWPAALIGLMRIGNRWGEPGQITLQNSMDDSWIPEIVSENSAYAFLGPDERVFLEGGDNYASYTVDGCHPNHAGYALTADEWFALLTV